MPRIAKATYGTGTLFKRGRIWYVSYKGRWAAVQRSSRSANIQDAKRLRDEIPAKKAQGDVGTLVTERITCNELLDDLLEYGKPNIMPSTAHVWELVINASLKAFLHVKAVALTAYFHRRQARRAVGDSCRNLRRMDDSRTKQS